MVSIITPAHNEESDIADYVSHALDFLKKEKIAGEVIVIENGSTDKTWSILSDLRKKNNNLVIDHLSKGNKGLALKKALLMARGDYLITLDTDLWDEKFVKQSIENLDQYDVVVGSKSIKGSKDERPLSSRLLNKGYNFLFRLVFNIKGTETHAKLSFRRKKITALVKECRTEDLVFDTELIIRAERSKLTKIELPTTVKEIRPRVFSVRIQLIKVINNFFLLLKILGPTPNYRYIISVVILLFLTYEIVNFVRYHV